LTINLTTVISIKMSKIWGRKKLNEGDGYEDENFILLDKNVYGQSFPLGTFAVEKR